MASNNSIFMPGMLSTQCKLICFIVSIKLLFCNVFIGSFNYYQLFFESINILDSYKII